MLSGSPNARAIHRLAPTEPDAADSWPSTPAISAPAICVSGFAATCSLKDAGVDNWNIPGVLLIMVLTQPGYKAWSVSTMTRATAGSRAFAGSENPPNESVVVRGSPTPRAPSPFASRNAPHPARYPTRDALPYTAKSARGRGG